MNYLFNPIVTGILGAIGGIVLVLDTKFCEGWINEMYENRKQARVRKVEAARDINAFCIEGMKTGFRHKPGSEEHILFRATEIEAIDQEVGEKMRVFLNSWMQNRNFLKDHPNEIEREKMAMGFRNDAQRYGEELLEVARKWGK